MGGTCSMHETAEKCNILVEKPERKKSERRSKNNIKKIGREDVNWLHLTQDRVQ
jgi:hypothetical protein